VNTLMLQDVLAEGKWTGLLTPEDRRGLTPLFWQHVLPYGEVKLDMTARLNIRTTKPGDASTHTTGRQPVRGSAIGQPFAQRCAVEMAAAWVSKTEPYRFRTESSRPSWVSTVCLASVSWREMPWREMPWRRQAIWRLRQLWRAAGSCPRRRAGRRRSAGVESHCSRGAMTAATSGSTACWYRPGTAVEEGRSRHGAPSGAMRQLLPPGCRSAGLLRRPIVLELTSHFIDLKCADE